MMKLKVFRLEAEGHYGGGMAIVAATDSKEATQLASSIIDDIWRTNYSNPHKIDELPLSCRGKARVITHFETGE